MTNKTGIDEFLFRPPTDSGKTFGRQDQSSNITDADSSRVEIGSDSDSVVVIWWETNDTSDLPGMRVSNDSGATFGLMLKLATNGTLGADSNFFYFLRLNVELVITVKKVCNHFCIVDTLN